MNRDQIEGGFRNLKGRGRTALGALRGDARPQFEGAYEQVAGIAQAAYGRTRERAEDLYDDGRSFADEAVERGRALRDDSVERGRALRDEAYARGRHVHHEARRHGQALATRVDDNRATTLALVALAAFGLGWLARRGR